MTRQAVNYIIRLAGEKANLGRVWPICRHSCGYYLADKGAGLTSGTEIPSLPRTTNRCWPVLWR